MLVSSEKEPQWVIQTFRLSIRCITDIFSLFCTDFTDERKGDKFLFLKLLTAFVIIIVLEIKPYDLNILHKKIKAN